MTRQELIEQQAKALEKFDRESALAAVWPDKVSVLQHDKFFSVTYKETYPKRVPLEKAVEIFNRIRGQFELVTAEHWKDGCVSCFPPEINSNATKERATLIASSAVEVTLNAGRGFDSHALSFWVRVPDVGLVHVSIELQPRHQWLPGIYSRQDASGEYMEWRVSFRNIGEDSHVGWWSPQGSYRRAYFWADSHNFEAWASHELAGVKS